MTLDPQAVARALGGGVSGRNVVAPGPGHGHGEHSLSIKIEPTAPDGFIVHSFAGDSPVECRDYVRASLGLGPGERRRRRASPRWSPPCSVAPDDDTAYRSVLALRLWNEARDENVTGFSVLVEWSRAEMPTPANNAGKLVASDDKEADHDR